MTAGQLKSRTIEMQPKLLNLPVEEFFVMRGDVYNHPGPNSRSMQLIPVEKRR